MLLRLKLISLTRSMTKDKLPNPNLIHPVKNHYDVIYPKNVNTSKRISIGDFTYISESSFKNNVIGNYGYSNDKLIIGKFCQIGKNVRFLLNDVNHEMNCISTFPFYIFDDWNESRPNNKAFVHKGNIIIGNDVWIGQNVTILPGIKIGNGAIIGANSTVGSNIPDYAIAVGNPCKIIKYRFSKKIINELNNIKWWDLKLEKIKKITHLLKSPNILEAINKIKRYLNS